MDDTIPPDPKAPAEQADGSVRSADGTEIGWHRSGSGDPAVLLHGTSGDSTGWALAAPYLAGQLALLSVDRRGRGRSGAGEPYDFDREVEDLVAVVGTLDVAPHVIGHSYGAMIALAAAATGLQLRGLVLYEPPITLADHIDVTGLADECERALATGDREQVLRSLFRVVGDETIVDMLKTQPSVLGRFLASTPTIPREVRAIARFSSIDLARIAVPAQLILGAESPEYYAESIAALHAAMPHSQVATLDGQAHLGHAFAPEAFADIILGFIAHVD